MKITAKQLASICGVSIGTVDRALNNRAGINPSTKEKVLRVAKELGYRPNYLARSLVKGKSMTIGLIIFNLHNQFFSQVVNAIESRAKESGYFVYLTMTDKDAQEEQNCLNHLVSLKADGIILFPVNKGSAFDQYLKSLHTPIVTIGNMISKSWPFVGIHDRSAIRNAVQHIVSKGYGRIVYVSPPLATGNGTNIYEVEERLAGYREAIQATPILGRSEVIRTRNIIEELKKIDLQERRKSAILCSSDKYALEVLEYLRTIKAKVPQEVGLMGFDNIDVLRYVSPRLATVAYPIEEMGRMAFDILIQQINGEVEREKIFLDCKIIEGESL